MQQNIFNLIARKVCLIQNLITVKVMNVKCVVFNVLNWKFILADGIEPWKYKSKCCCFDFIYHLFCYYIEAD